MKSGIPATFTVRIRQEVLYLTSATLRFKTSPLKSSVTTSASGGSSAPTSDGGGDHDHVISAVPTGDLTTLPVANYKGYGVKQTDGVLVTWLIAMAVGQPGLAIKTFASSGTHTHDVTIAAHTHAMAYDVFKDTVHPQVISVKINGVDRTSALGGTWAPSNASVEEELDITTYLADDAGGLNQLHTIEFTCTTGKGEIEVEIDMRVTIQDIAVFT